MIKATQSCISFWLFCVLLMNRINTTPIQSVKGIHVILPNIPLSQHGQLDLAFLMDTTGSMTSYINSAKQNIREIVEEIVATSKSDVRLALIEYRDHSPEDKTFVTRKNDFTSSVSIMKSWLTVARARGGGDRPEAVADAMYQATKLSWRQDATKMCVMISDAPPHGLVPSEDTSFPYGSPNGHDPMQIARDLAQKGVTLYIIGVEPPVVPYKDFFMGLAYLTGGQYVPLSVPRLLVNVITGGALEELSLQRFQEEVQQEIEKAYGGGGGGGGIGGGGDGPINKDQIANSVYQRLQKSGAKSKQLVKNNNAIEGPSANAKLLASKYSMAEVRKVFKKGITPRTLGGFGGIRGGGGGGFGSKSGGDGVGSEGGGGGGGGGVGGLSIPNSSASDIYSAKESGITLEQINRLVERKTARLPSG